MRLTTAYAIAWMSCAVAAVAGIVVMKSLTPLWVFVIPAMLSITTGGSE
jgi:hypothetical protein